MTHIVASTKPCLWIDYTDRAGQRAWRRVRPHGFEWVPNASYRDPTWRIICSNLDDDEVRAYPVARIHAFSVVDPARQPLRSADERVAELLARSSELLEETRAQRRRIAELDAQLKAREATLAAWAVLPR